MTRFLRAIDTLDKVLSKETANTTVFERREFERVTHHEIVNVTTNLIVRQKNDPPRKKIN